MSQPTQVGPRLALAFATLCVPIGLGIAQRPWSVLPLLAILMTVQFALGKWHAWQRTWTTRGLPGILGAIVGTLLVQGLLAALLLSIGYFIGWLAGVEPRPMLTTVDGVVLGTYGVLATLLGVYVVRAETTSTT